MGYILRVRARKDSNHKEIVDALRDMGISVLDTSQLGNGAPDIVIGFRGKSILIEIKDGNKPPSQRKLTKDEGIFQSTWKGEYVVVKSLDEVLALLKSEV
jgi:Holliday junction resolvase